MLCINSVLAHLRRIDDIALQIDVDGATGTFRAFDSLPGVGRVAADGGRLSQRIAWTEIKRANNYLAHNQYHTYWPDSLGYVHRISYLQIFTVPAMGAGPLQTSYGKEVPVYSPLAQGATLHVMEAVAFHREPDLRGSVKCLQRRVYNILVTFANKF